MKYVLYGGWDWIGVGDFHKNQVCMIMTEDKKHGVLKSGGGLLISPVYDKVEEIFNHGWCVLKRDNRFYLIDYNGVVVYKSVSFRKMLSPLSLNLDTPYFFIGDAIFIGVVIKQGKPKVRKI